MTKEEALNECTIGFSNQPFLPSIIRRALDIAEEHGAKFDPEPVDLPPLAYEIIAGIGPHIRLQVPVACTGGVVSCLTDKEAEEVIRRCRAVSELREFLKLYTMASTREILDILDGKMVGSRSVEGGHAF